ncbi:hypothetical protein OSB04_022343 [Centaurea solstitialis]|uniref:Uncharacterized protein n=1 Tax=Centaurea solstitialis TaxID=347529 RepID=A0AA38WF23_9ASTR|nr:hypothetical protein OSB04_022343 [Centaurea solstitialis]
MTQCSDQWLTTVSSLSWTKLLIDLVLFLSISSVSAFHGLNTSPDRRKLRRPDLAGTGPRRNRTSPEPDLAGTGPEMSPEPDLSKINQVLILPAPTYLSGTGPVTSPEPELTGTGCRRNRTGNSLFES